MFKLGTLRGKSYLAKKAYNLQDTIYINIIEFLDVIKSFLKSCLSYVTFPSQTIFEKFVDFFINGFLFFLKFLDKSLPLNLELTVSRFFYKYIIDTSLIIFDFFLKIFDFFFFDVTTFIYLFLCSFLWHTWMALNLFTPWYTHIFRPLEYQILALFTIYPLLYIIKKGWVELEMSNSIEHAVFKAAKILEPETIEWRGAPKIRSIRFLFLTWIGDLYARLVYPYWKIDLYIRIGYYLISNFVVKIFGLISLLIFFIKSLITYILYLINPSLQNDLFQLLFIFVKKISDPNLFQLGPITYNEKLLIMFSTCFIIFVGLIYLMEMLETPENFTFTKKISRVNFILFLKYIISKYCKKFWFLGEFFLNMWIVSGLKIKLFLSSLFLKVNIFLKKVFLIKKTFNVKKENCSENWITLYPILPVNVKRDVDNQQCKKDKVEEIEILQKKASYLHPLKSFTYLKTKNNTLENYYYFLVRSIQIIFEILEFLEFLLSELMNHYRVLPVFMITKVFDQNVKREHFLFWEIFENHYLHYIVQSNVDKKNYYYKINFLGNTEFLNNFWNSFLLYINLSTFLSKSPRFKQYSGTGIYGKNHSLMQLGLYSEVTIQSFLNRYLFNYPNDYHFYFYRYSKNYLSFSKSNDLGYLKHNGLSNFWIFPLQPPLSYSITDQSVFAYNVFALWQSSNEILEIRSAGLRSINLSSWNEDFLKFRHWQKNAAKNKNVPLLDMQTLLFEGLAFHQKWLDSIIQVYNFKSLNVNLTQELGAHIALFYNGKRNYLDYKKLKPVFYTNIHKKIDLKKCFKNFEFICSSFYAMGSVTSLKESEVEQKFSWLVNNEKFLKSSFVRLGLDSQEHIQDLHDDTTWFLDYMMTYEGSNLSNIAEEAISLYAFDNMLFVLDLLDLTGHQKILTYFNLFVKKKKINTFLKFKNDLSMFDGKRRADRLNQLLFNIKREMILQNRFVSNNNWFVTYNKFAGAFLVYQMHVFIFNTLHKILSENFENFFFSNRYLINKNTCSETMLMTESAKNNLFYLLKGYGTWMYHDSMIKPLINFSSEGSMRDKKVAFSLFLSSFPRELGFSGVERPCLEKKLFALYFFKNDVYHDILEKNLIKHHYVSLEDQLFIQNYFYMTQSNQFNYGYFYWDYLNQMNSHVNPPEISYLYHFEKNTPNKLIKNFFFLSFEKKFFGLVPFRKLLQQVLSLRHIENKRPGPTDNIDYSDQKLGSAIRQEIEILQASKARLGTGHAFKQTFSTSPRFFFYKNRIAIFLMTPPGILLVWYFIRYLSG